MAHARILHSHGRRLAAASVLSTAALLSAAACTGSTQPGPTATTVRTSAAASATASTAAASPSPSAQSATAVPARSSSAASGSAPCGNGDLRISWGYGTQSTPLQAAAVVFTNVADHTCTLQGYPGAAIADGGTVVNAARVLNGFRGDLPPLTSPPLVTLAPGAVAYAVAGWRLHDGQACYPTGTGAFEFTAPNTTKTVTLSKVTTGLKGICSSLEINPIVSGTFGVAVGS